MDLVKLSVWPNPSLLSWLVFWIDIRTFGKPHRGLSSHHNNIYVLFYYDKSTMNMTRPMMTRTIAKTMMMMMMMIVYLLGGQPPVMVFQVPLICPHRSKQHFLDVYTLSRTASISRPQLKNFIYPHISFPKNKRYFCECVL